MSDDEVLTRAEAHLSMGDTENAERALTAAWRDISRAPGDAQHLMATIRLEQRRVDEAVQLMRGAVRTEPNSLRHHIALGHMLRGAGDAAGAMEAYAAAGRIDPKWPGLLLVYSHAAFDCRKYEEAERAARQLVQETPSVDAWNALSGALRALGKGQEALAAAEEALRLDPHDMPAHNHRGAALLVLNRPQEALDVFDAMEAQGLRAPVLSLNRGAALQMLGRDREASHVYDEAATLWPHYPNLQSQIARRRG